MASTPKAFIKELANRLGRTEASLLVMSNNCDPFNVGRPADLRKARWFAGLVAEAAADGIGTYHLRRIHYRLIDTGHLPDGGPYRNTKRHWSILCEASRHARDLGLVDADINDKRNTAIQWPEATVRLPGGDGGYVVRPRLEVPVVDAPVVEDPFPWPRRDYGYARTLDERYLPVLFIEKSSLDDVLVPLCADLGIVFISGKGFTSHTRVRN